VVPGPPLTDTGHEQNVGAAIAQFTESVINDIVGAL
jgi:hypothetical protein